MKDDTREFILYVMPVIIMAFLIIAITLICDNKWITALVQIPAWAGLILWMWIRHKWVDDY